MLSSATRGHCSTRRKRVNVTWPFIRQIWIVCCCRHRHSSHHKPQPTDEAGYVELSRKWDDWNFKVVYVKVVGRGYPFSWKRFFLIRRLPPEVALIFQFLPLVTQDCSFVAIVASLDFRVAMNQQSKDNGVVDAVEKLKRKYVENWKQVRVSTT